MMTLDDDTDPVSDLDLEPDPDFNSASNSKFLILTLSLLSVLHQNLSLNFYPIKY